MKTFVITVNRLLTESPVRPMLTNMCFQCVPFVSMKNMDCSEEEILHCLNTTLAEEAAIPKKNRKTN